MIVLTKAAYKTLRGITDTDRDDQIEAALPAAEDAIAAYNGRDFAAPVVTETRKFRVEGPIVNIDDVSEITEVKIDDHVLVADEDYVASPQDPRQPYYYLDLAYYTYRPASPEMGFTRNEDVFGSRPFRFISVTGKWGWDTAPKALQLAVALFVDEVATAASHRRGVSAEAVADTSVVYEAPESANAPPVLPPVVEQLLNRYRRIEL